MCCIVLCNVALDAGRQDEGFRGDEVLRPEEPGENKGVEESLLEPFWISLPRVHGRRALDHRVNVRVDALGLGNVLEHDLALAEGALAEAQLEQLEGAHLLVGVKRRGGQDLLREHVPVLAHKQLLGPVDVHQQRDDIARAPRFRRFGRIRVQRVGLPHPESEKKYIYIYIKGDENIYIYIYNSG